ncbi:hypothetical protein NCAS_0A03000 [Naumovozyma castellii]|uniref:Uncharacterized protein n=1 Tax=Naumovozyma castellii TaxID=27288 RepID=G0V5X0_NAUCA|nr:hypothetical protein NCAS_0A03000 [Naumovozyma castellii CBS 4309]CCC66858.1 hypothetical protein NCAS_0A03000 [Naumovozyma castellii CBS 4309]
MENNYERDRNTADSNENANKPSRQGLDEIFSATNNDHQSNQPQENVRDQQKRPPQPTNISSINNNNNNNNNNDEIEDDYDYEMQDYKPIPFTSNSKPTTTYIPQYVVGGQNHFQMHEVIPNSDMTHLEMNNNNNGTYQDSNSNSNNNNNPNYRPRGATVSSNVLNLEGFYTKGSEDVGTNPGSSTLRRRNTDAGSQHSGVTNPTKASAIHEYDETHPGNVPIMVKPKTLYQNPQTPTVLPSTYHPINRWSILKQTYLKEFLAEFMGTMVMIIYGSAVVCQVLAGGQISQNTFNDSLAELANDPNVDAGTLKVIKSMEQIISTVPFGTFDDIALGWAAAVVMGYFCAGGSAISGAHLNPSITISNFIYRGFPAKKVPYYLLGQLLGAFAGALILFIYYKKVIEEAYPEYWKTETVASMFCVFPKPFLSTSRQFISEFLCGAMLQAGLFGLTDPYTCLSSDLFPLMLFILIFVIMSSLDYQTGTAMNLARDLGPRLALYAVGFDRKMLWIDHHHFFWVPMVAPIIGALTGGLVYDICIYQGHESPVNWPFSVYKEMIMRLWIRRPGWKNRTRARRTSEFSDFSYNDDVTNGNSLSKNGDEANMYDLTKSKSAKSDLSTEVPEKSVQFKSVQRDKRFKGGIPTILEEEESMETTSLGAITSNSESLIGSFSTTSSPEARKIR